MSQQRQEQKPWAITLPHAAWMWKPRSKKVIEHNFGDVAASFLGMRLLGAQKWKRRYVFVEGDTICYGRSVGQRDKVIPLEIVQAANYATHDVLLVAKAPSAMAQFGWFMLIKGKELLFCCENDSAREEWVTFILARLRLISGMTKPALLTAMGENSQTVPPLIANCIEEQRGGAAEGGQVFHMNLAQSVDAFELKGQIEEGSSRVLGEAVRHESQPHVGAQDDKDADTLGHLLSFGNTKDLVEDAISDKDGHASYTTPMSQTMDVVQGETLADVHAFALLPYAQERYSHIAYKLESFSRHLQHGDNIQNVVFSRCVEKIGKHDTTQERDLLLTPQYLYLFARKKLTGRVHSRCVDTNQIAGVIASITETNLLAIIVPCFHDILIRFHSQNSHLGGTKASVKIQLIAHLYKIHLGQKTGRRFLFREVENVRAVIRRGVEEPHMPLISYPEDRMQVGTNKSLFPLFSIHAESLVFWSSMITRVEEDRRLQLCALAITDGAVYLLSETLVKVTHRIPLPDVHDVKFDVDSQTVLLHSTEVDALFKVHSSVEFIRLIELLPEVVMQYCGVKIPATASKQLYAHARFAEPGGREESIGGLSSLGAVREHLNLPSRVLSSMHPVRFKTYFGKQHTNSAEAPEVHNTEDASGSWLSKRLGSRAYLAHYRFVEELVVDFDDEASMLANIPSTAADALTLNGPFATDLGLGSIQCSLICSDLDVKSLPTGIILSPGLLSKHGTRRVVCVSTRGIVLLNHHDGVGKLCRTFKDLLWGRKGSVGADVMPTDSVRTHDPRVLVFLSWPDVVGLVRCYPGQGTIIGVMTGPGQSCDYMLDVESDSSVDVFLRCSAWNYVEGHRRSQHAYEMLPLFKVPHVENVRNALKNSVFDSKPILALRRPLKHHAGDELGLAVVPNIAEACRSFGDNTIYFSGAAWRYEAAAPKTERRKNRTAGPETREVSHSAQETHKMFIIVLTNCAIYWCTDGDLGILQRTELLALGEVYLSPVEPDALLITVPKEYDMYFRIDGRGKEFLARLQDAYAAWTDYHRHLPHESRGSYQNVPDGELPTTTVSNRTSLGQLAKLSHFAELQANFSSGETRTRMELMHRRYLAVALSKYEAALVMTIKRKLSWAKAYKSLSAAKTTLEFSHRRAYSFSLRTSTHPEMEQAQMRLHEFCSMKEILERMQQAAATEDLATYEAASEKAQQYAPLLAFVEESREVHEALAKRTVALVNITTFIDSDTRLPLQESADTLQALFVAAMEAGVQPDMLDKLRRRVDLRTQQEAFLAQLQAHSMAVATGTEKLQSVKLLLLLAEAARQLEVPVSAVETAFSGLPRAVSRGEGKTQRQLPLQQQEQNARSVIVATCDAIEVAVSLGNATLLQDVLRLAERSPCEEVKARARWGREQLGLRRKHLATHRLPPRLMEHIVVRRQSREWGAGEVHKLRDACAEALRELPVDVPFMLRDRQLLQSQLHLLEEEEHRLILRDSLQTQAEQDGDRYMEELQKKEVDERHATQERGRQQVEMIGQWRMDYLLIWQGRTSKLCASMRESIRLGNTEEARRCIGQCVFFQKKIQEGLLNYNSCRTHVCDAQQMTEKILNDLKMAAARGQAFLAGHEEEAEPYVSPVTRNNDAEVAAAENLGEEVVEGRGMVVAAVPPELLVLIEAHKAKELVTYVRLHASELNAETIVKVRELWSASRERRQWVAKLHRAIHTAFALKNREMLQTHIDAAKSFGYMDDVVEGAMEVVAAMEAQQYATPGAGSGSRSPSPELGLDASQDETPRTFTLSRVYDARSSDAAERLLGQLHAVTLEMLQPTEPGLSLSNACLQERRHKRMMDVAQLWHDVFHHRLKPSGGVFRRNERDCFDFLHFVSQHNTSRDHSDFYTNRLLSDFGRVKKYNTTQGRSSSFLLIAYMFQRKLLERILHEIAQLGAKVRGEVLCEDALLNQSLPDLLALARMGEQAEWSVMVSEAPDGVVVNANTSFTLMSIVDETPADELTNSVARGKQQGTCEVPRKAALQSCAELMRSATSVLSNYFSGKFAALGVCPSVEDARAIFDEGVHREIGLIVQEHLLPAVVALMRAGFRPIYHLVRTRRVWDAVLEFGACLQHGSRDLSGVSVSGVIPLVEAVTDVTGRQRTKLQRLSEDELADLRLRMLLIECLNRNVLAAFLRIFFQGEEGTTCWANGDGVWKFYDRDRCVFYPPEDAGTQELMEVVTRLSELPFVLFVDRELW
ncbi:putative protein kinase [Trypanosoma rangeli]|uniref:PH domain-containing protein n=1 Tax=Trypanosoma rangeli TaxID=5698 RepID=A0A422N432_TRYRA|nr:putative protein kinase [Trypanosoma rangeli]RNF00216.1 putative protein kinase [Trypanosoma rangeli]|eukprot:RNF00216.1 putative protein kinase [Trypanosoma rangeli]